MADWHTVLALIFLKTAWLWHKAMVSSQPHYPYGPARRLALLMVTQKRTDGIRAIMTRPSGVSHRAPVELRCGKIRTTQWTKQFSAIRRIGSTDCEVFTRASRGILEHNGARRARSGGVRSDPGPGLFRFRRSHPGRATRRHSGRTRHQWPPDGCCNLCHRRCLHLVDPPPDRNSTRYRRAGLPGFATSPIAVGTGLARHRNCSSNSNRRDHAASRARNRSGGHS